MAAKGKRRMLCYDYDGFSIVHNTLENSIVCFRSLDKANSLIKKENIKIGVYQFEVGEIYNEIGDDRKTSAGYISVFIEKPKGLRYEGFFIEAGKDDREPTKWLLFRITHEGKFNGYRKDLFGKMFGSGWDGFDDAYFAFGVLGDVNEPIETLNLFTRNSVGSVRIILMDAKPITNNQ